MSDQYWTGYNLGINAGGTTKSNSLQITILHTQKKALP